MTKSKQSRGSPKMSKYSIIALLEAVKIISGLVDNPEQVKQAAEQMQTAVINASKPTKQKRNVPNGNSERSEQLPD